MTHGNPHNTYRPMTPKHALQLAAPHTWAASVCPALFGLLYCGLRGLPLGPFRSAALFAACVLMQSAVNTLNDYFDFVKGTDSADDHVEVSDATLVYAGIAPKSALWLGLGYLGTAAVLGIACCIGSGIAPLLVGLFGGAMIVFYSAGPCPVSYLPVGELVSGFTMGGLIPLGIAACGSGRLMPEVLLYSLPFIVSIGLIMMSNNGCDIEKDQTAGRRTLPVLLGRKKTLTAYRTLIVFWLGLLAVLPLLLVGAPGALCPVLLVLTARKAVGRLLKLELQPQQRILQMKSIAAANIVCNGAYLAALAAARILEAAHG